MRRVALLAVAAVALLVAPVARGAAPSQVGWWWSGHLEQLPVAPPPPDVPAGGLYVGGGPNGASGISALRFDLPAGAAEPVLTLAVASSTGTVVFGACRAAAAWQPAEGGKWEQRPVAACDRGAVAATLSTEGGTTTARLPLSALLDGTTLDVVLVPGKDPTTGVDATFDVSFEAPGPDALAVSSPPAAPQSGESTPPPVVAPAPGAVGTPAVPPPATPTTTAPAPFAPAANVSDTPADPAALSSPPSGAGRALPGTPSSASGRLVGVLLAVVTVGAFLLMTRTGLGAQLAATSGGRAGPERGIGRFSATRDTPPPTL